MSTYTKIFTGSSSLVWMSPRERVFCNMKFQWVYSLEYGLLAQAFYPAGPDGVGGWARCQSGHLA